MQPSVVGPSDGRLDPAVPLHARAILPVRSQAVEFAWSGAMARARLIHGFDSRLAQSRSFNLIRAKLAGLQREQGWRRIGVVSATASVGKSFVASNIAASLSRDSRFQTYLIDFDLRRGSLKDVFGFQPAESLVEYLDGSVSRPTGYVPRGEDLIIIPSNSGPIASAELLANAQASALFEAMNAASDQNYFVCDLPPVFANDDAAIILASLDGYIIVVEDGKTTQQEVLATIDMLGQEQLAGVVLNKFRGGLVSEGYGVEERYGSSYYSAEDPA